MLEKTQPGKKQKTRQVTNTIDDTIKFFFLVSSRRIIALRPTRSQLNLNAQLHAAAIALVEHR